MMKKVLLTIASLALVSPAVMANGSFADVLGSGDFGDAFRGAQLQKVDCDTELDYSSDEEGSQGSPRTVRRSPSRDDLTAQGHARRQQADAALEAARAPKGIFAKATGLFFKAVSYVRSFF